MNYFFNLHICVSVFTIEMLTKSQFRNEGEVLTKRPRALLTITMMSFDFKEMIGEEN